MIARPDLYVSAETIKKQEEAEEAAEKARRDEERAARKAGKELVPA